MEQFEKPQPENVEAEHNDRVFEALRQSSNDAILEQFSEREQQEIGGFQLLTQRVR